MFCPFCGEQDTKVIDSRLVAEGTQVRRRRSCPACHERFTSFEVAALEMPQVIKRDGRLVVFSEKNIRRGMVRAFQKSTDANDLIEQSVSDVLAHIRARGERELPSQHIGEIVLKVLKDIDPVAYIRYASVYLSFGSIADFQQLMDDLKEKPATKKTEVS